MSEKRESLALWLLHAFDRMVAPKDKPPDPAILARRQAAEESMNQLPLEEFDDIGAQVAKLKRRNEIMAAAAPEGLWNK